MSFFAVSRRLGAIAGTFPPRQRAYLRGAPGSRRLLSDFCWDTLDRSEEAQREMFEQWKAMWYNKTYKSAAEEEIRFRAFKDVLRYVDRRNAENPGLGVTGLYSDFTKEDLDRELEGCLSCSEEEEERIRREYNYKGPIDLREYHYTAMFMPDSPPYWGRRD